MLEDKNDKQSLAAETLEPKPVMNTDVLQQTTFDVVDGEKRFVFGEDTSQFTQSNRLAKNLGTYYFKHEDTDSDMDKIVQSLSKNDASTTQEETSEDEWTYTKPDQDVISPVLKPKTIPEETIKLLVQKAEELVHQETKGTRMSRVKQWLSMDKPEESCDASCEDDETSQTSDELNESSATFKATSRNTSVLDLITPEDTPKVQLRQRKHNGSRPWSVSCIMQLETPNKTNYSMLSTSESALHCMSSTPKKLSTGSQYNTTSTLNNGNHSTSSTLEESSNVLQEEKSSPCRRRKLKMRRKCSNKTHNNKTNQRLFKSSSYSGATSAFTGGVNERQTSSDPPATSIFNCQKCETTSGAETDDSFNKRVPQFKIGSQTSYLTDVSDSNPGKSLNTTEEQSSSMSEQAWDSYQEKYLSEAYSEAHDSDAARRLLEFGEDYRNFIDSQSDWSKNSDFSPTYRRRTLKVPNHVPESLSDSDTESLAHLINTSRDQLVYTQEIYKQQVNLGLGQYLATNEIGEMVSTSDRHIDILQHIERSFENCAISREDKKAATELLEKWRQFKKSVLKMQDYRNLQKEILQMKHTLGTFKIPESDSLIEMAYIDDLEKDVAKYEQIQSNIKDYKEKLLELNVAVHHFVVENKEYNSSSLKNDISQLYCLWEELHSQAIERIARLKPLLDTWRTLEMRLDQLHGDLQSDEKTLKLIDNAVEGSGALSEQTATYVREVAKLLSETNHSMQGCTLPELFTEGSLSDSGISDEGSEHELGERERRLAAIRRLVRQLEVNISPDSDARIRMTERLNAAEEELKSLQKKCRSLIVRSAACHVPAEFREADKEPQVKPKDDGGEPDREPSSSWFRRAVRASVPFQLVLVTILCIAWLLEPQCCDNMNNYAWSLSPQLRYINGPPPT